MKTQTAKKTAKHTQTAPKEVRKLAGRPKSYGPKVDAKAPKAKVFPQKDPTKEDDVEDGQKGPKLELPYDRLNAKEAKVLHTFNHKGAREILTIESLAEKAFPNQSRAKANSWVRNSLRRLVRGEWIENVRRGNFRLTHYGLMQLRKLDKKHELKTAAA